MPDRTMKVGDTYEPLVVTARDANGRVNLTTATALAFRARATVGAAVVFVTGAGVNVENVDGPGGTDPADTLPVNRGKVRYAQLVDDFDTSALYDIEVKVTWADGSTTKFPSAEAVNPKLQVDDELTAS